MRPTEKVPLADRFPRSLDWWFAPPWRALFTWMILLGFSGWLLDSYARELISGTILYVDLRMPFQVPDSVGRVTFFSNMAVLLVWFEPLVLRLSLVHGLAWVGLRMFPSLVSLWFSPPRFAPIDALAILLCSVFAVSILHGQRSRPWISAIGGVPMAVLDYGVRSGLIFRATGSWLWMPTMTLPYAVALLYGTRLLTPEEREGKK